MKKITIALVLVLAVAHHSFSQTYSVNKNTHSHNDYLQSQPFYLAHANHFGSMEIDVFLRDTNLFVAHTPEEIKPSRTIESLYLLPLLRELQLNEGKAYSNGDQLQFLIDLKTEGAATLRLLEKKLKPIRQYFDVANNPDAVKLVITGNVPSPGDFEKYDPVFFFDGNAQTKYTQEQLKRVALISAPFFKYSVWNGLGRMVAPELNNVKNFVDSIHQQGKPVRFWGNPDTRTAWISFMKLGVDFLNTDSPSEMAKFLNNYKDNTYVAHREAHKIYQPGYKADVLGKRPKNVILLISDGAGFSQLWAAATANRGRLNVAGFKHIGFSNTTSDDDYNTDSAAGATAMSTGQKTKNRHIGTDSLGRPLSNIVDQLWGKKIVSGIITNDKVTGATPSSFFAHQNERNDNIKIAGDLLNSKVSLLIGGEDEAFKENDYQLTKALKQQGFTFQNGISDDTFSGSRLICFDKDNTTNNHIVIESAFDRSIAFLKNQKNNNGFFLMIEGAKIDGGGHSNKIQQCIDEYLSFDKVVGKALQFADNDGETLVIVTSDHETGGLILFDGNYNAGTVTGTFTTTDHTGLPVPVLSYGPGAERFTGFINNNEIPLRIMELLTTQKK